MENPIFAIRAAALAGFILIASGPVATLYGAISGLAGAAQDAALVVDARRL